jgi:hypothetical protein
MLFASDFSENSSSSSEDIIFAEDFEWNVSINAKENASSSEDERRDYFPVQRRDNLFFSENFILVDEMDTDIGESKSFKITKFNTLKIQDYIIHPSPSFEDSSFMLSLPNEILSDIFSYLSRTSDAISFGKTCKRLYSCFICVVLPSRLKDSNYDFKHCWNCKDALLPLVCQRHKKIFIKNKWAHNSRKLHVSQDLLLLKYFFKNQNVSLSYVKEFYSFFIQNDNANINPRRHLIQTDDDLFYLWSISHYILPKTWTGCVRFKAWLTFIIKDICSEERHVSKIIQRLSMFIYSLESPYFEEYLYTFETFCRENGYSVFDLLKNYLIGAIHHSVHRMEMALTRIIDKSIYMQQTELSDNFFEALDLSNIILKATTYSFAVYSYQWSILHSEKRKILYKCPLECVAYMYEVFEFSHRYLQTTHDNVYNYGMSKAIQYNATPLIDLLLNPIKKKKPLKTKIKNMLFWY